MSRILGEVDPIRRIYVNRNLRLSQIRAIGFDMDHTLALYKPLPFERLAFAKAREKLVRRGWPRAVLRFTYDHDFVVRGLIVDRRRGNILKMDRHHYVVRAFHGTRKIPGEMRKHLYAHRRIRITGTTYAPIDTLFSLPEISLYAQMVDFVDTSVRRPNYRALYDDVRSVVDEAHADGSIKSVIADEPSRYLEYDPRLATTLARMVTHGIKLFLLTNSEPEYTGLIMDHLLSGKVEGFPHWSDFFDLVVVKAGKPSFFGRHTPLIPIAPAALGMPDRKGSRRSFAGGSVRALEKALGISGDAILYFGDHTYGDILKSKRLCGWRTAMIIQELEEEIAHLAQTRHLRERLAELDPMLDRLAAWRDFLERAEEGNIPKTALRRFLKETGLGGGMRQIKKHVARLRHEIEALGAELEDIESRVDQTFNRNWGPIFRAGREVSHFGAQVEEFACIYTSRVSNFLNYPMDKYFVTHPIFMPHETQ